MSASLDSIVTISISATAQQVTQAGFGTALLLSPTPTWIERTREYASLADVAADFAAGTAEYRAANAVFAQSPAPKTLKIGRCALPPTQRFALTPAVHDSTVYKFTVKDPTGDANVVSYTSDSDATAAEIIGGLKTAFDLLALAVTSSDQTTYLRLLANAAGAFFSVEVDDPSLLGIAQDHADPGLATDLTNIALEDDDWYAILHMYNSKACVDALTAYAEANTKQFVAQSQESDILTSSSADVASGQQTLENFRIALIYHPRTDAFADAAWAGATLPLDPGSETWAYKTLAGVEAVELTTDQRANAFDKNCNTYERIAGVNKTRWGQEASGEFIDVVRFRDWLQARMQERVAGSLMNAPGKVPFTDAGIAVIQADLLAVLKDGVAVGGLAEDPAPAVLVPRARDVSTTDKNSRNLTGVTFTATLAGAIHAVDVTGTITV